MKKINFVTLKVGLLAAFLIAFSSNVSASVVFSDNFEDGNHSGWLASVTGDIGSTGVELNNGSQMAFVQHTGSGLHSLSIDFSYVGSAMLSFDMQAISTTATALGEVRDGRGGVTLSFLDKFNTPIGSTSLVNVTYPSSLGPNDHLVDINQHNYSALLSDYASLAGLGTTDSISKVALTFFASGLTGTFAEKSSSKVWFDNVTIGAVPIPGAVWLFGSALLGLTRVAKRKNAEAV